MMVSGAQRDILTERERTMLAARYRRAGPPRPAYIVAAELGVSQNTVWKTIARARARLRGTAEQLQRGIGRGPSPQAVADYEQWGWVLDLD